MKPDTILVKFNINPKWEAKLVAVGVPRRTPDESALEIKHMFHAVEMGRNPYERRSEIADSGIPIFGKDGECDVSIIELFDELHEEGYIPSDVHIRVRTREGAKFNALVIPFVQTNGNIVSTPAPVISLVGELINVSWGYVHIWRNPPQQDGKMIDTVNLSHRDVDKSPQKKLRFRKGRWAVIPL